MYYDYIDWAWWAFGDNWEGGGLSDKSIRIAPRPHTKLRFTIVSQIVSKYT